MTTRPTIDPFDYTAMTIRYDRQRLWWEVVRPDGVVVCAGPTSGSIATDAQSIQHRLEHLGR